MSGIYIHIPFCKSKCSYCDFYSISDFSSIDLFIKSLFKEFEIKRNLVSDYQIDTIYIGGGTPSIMNIDFYIKLFNKLNSLFLISSNSEITIELNPDDINEEFISQLKNFTPINRISVGVQSFVNTHLKFFNRRHDAKSAYESIILCSKFFDNISVDFIYGFHLLTNDLFFYNLNKFCNLPVKHISAYHLSYECNTDLFYKLNDGIINILSEEQSFFQYNNLVEFFNNRGFFQYEISNFAKSDFTSKHNSSYWNNIDYLGFGPSAHSYIQNKFRYYNFSNINVYIENILNGEIFYNCEKLSDKDIFNEYIMTNLRQTKGINLSEMYKFFSKDEVDAFIYTLNSKFSSFYDKNNNFVSLNSKGLFISDYIISTLFIN